MPLEDLLQCIMDTHSPEWLRNRLECQDIQLSPLDTDAELRDQLLTKLRQLCCDCQPYWVVRKICSKEGLISMLRDRSYNTDSKQGLNSVKMPELAEQVMRAFGVPFPETSSVWGPKSIRKRLMGYKSDIDQYVRQLRRAGRRRQEPDILRGLNISCWTYLEKFLKQVLGFYALHFGRFAFAIAEELCAAFIEVSRVEDKPLGRVLEAFKEVEFIFNEGESRRQRKEREHRLKEEVDKANDAQSVVELARREDEAARQRAQQLSRRLRQECEDAFGRSSPFSLLPLDDIQTLVSRYRNPYAHETIEDLMRVDPTGEKVKESIKSALKLVDDFIDDFNIAPRLVFLVAEAYDAYGRRAILYIEEDQLDQLVDQDMPLPLLARTGHFYNNTFSFQPLVACFLVEREGVGANYEPPVYRYEDVEAAIVGRRLSETG